MGCVVSCSNSNSSTNLSRFKCAEGRHHPGDLTPRDEHSFPRPVNIKITGCCSRWHRNRRISPAWPTGPSYSDRLARCDVELSTCTESGEQYNCRHPLPVKTRGIVRHTPCPHRAVWRCYTRSTTCTVCGDPAGSSTRLPSLTWGREQLSCWHLST